MRSHWKIGLELWEYCRLDLTRRVLGLPDQIIEFPKSVESEVEFQTISSRITEQLPDFDLSKVVATTIEKNGKRRYEIDNSFLGMINYLGQDGWEMIAVQDNGLYFKRPIAP